MQSRTKDCRPSIRIERDLASALKPYIIRAALPSILKMLQRDSVRMAFSCRKTQTLGYYKPPVSKGKSTGFDSMHTISLQIDLNPYALLFVLLHEWAHLLTRKQHGPEAPAHGKAWKQNFKSLASPFLNEAVFPKDILASIHTYFIKTSRFFDFNLQKACGRYGNDRREFMAIYRKLQQEGIDIPAPDFGWNRIPSSPAVLQKATVSDAKVPDRSAAETDSPERDVPLPKAKDLPADMGAGPSSLRTPHGAVGQAWIKDLEKGSLIALDNASYRILERVPPFVLAQETGSDKVVRLHFLLQVDVLEPRTVWAGQT